MFDGQGRRKYLNHAERQAFFKAANAVTDKKRRAFALTLLCTGCRISEALNLTCDRIDVSQKTLVFETLKQRRRGLFRAIPVPASLIVLLGETARTVRRTRHIWRYSRPTAYRLIIRLMAQASIAGAMASPKGLRHGFAVACVSQSVPLPTLQKWLGHALLETTAIYLGVCGEEERNLMRRVWLK